MTDTTNKPTIAPEVNMVMDVAKSNRIWNNKHVLHIYGVKEQDTTKVSFLDTDFARQAIHSIKLLHEKESENGYGWDDPASATILRAVVQNDVGTKSSKYLSYADISQQDDWLFQ